MKEIMILVFMFISYGIPIIFIMKDITDLHETIINIAKNDMQVFVDFDKRLKKLEKSNKKNEKK